MPFAFCSVLVLSTLGLLRAHPRLFFPARLPLCPADTGTHRPRGSRNPTLGGRIWGFASSFTSAAALEAQGAGEGSHGGVEGVSHRRGLAGGGVRLAAVAVGLAGLLVHPQGRQRELLPTGRGGGGM